MLIKLLAKYEFNRILKCYLKFKNTTNNNHYGYFEKLEKIAYKYDNVEIIKFLREKYIKTYNANLIYDLLLYNKDIRIIKYCLNTNYMNLYFIFFNTCKYNDNIKQCILMLINEYNLDLNKIEDESIKNFLKSKHLQFINDIRKQKIIKFLK